MRWRKQVTAETLPELELAAERCFRPGTTYSIYSIREETPAGVILSYRAEAHLAEPPGAHSTAARPAGRRGGQAGTEFGQGAVRGRRSGTGPSGPDAGPVTGRIIDAPGRGTGGGAVGGAVAASGGGAVASAVADSGAGAGGGAGAAVGLGVPVPGGGPVTGYNPATVDELPGWRPETIPAPVLAGGPSLGAAYALLKDPGPDPPPVPAFATDDPGFVSLLDHAAPAGDAPQTGSAATGPPPGVVWVAGAPSGAVPVAGAPFADPAMAGSSHGRSSNGAPSADDSASGALTAAQQAQLIDDGAVVPMPPADADTESQGKHGSGNPVAPEGPPTGGVPGVDPSRDGRDAAAGGAAGGTAATPPHPEDTSPRGTAVKSPLTGDGTRPAQPGRVTVVYVGLLDDPVEAAERSGHRRWSAAGVLNGGQPGAHVVCYGLGDGSNTLRLAHGLHRYQPMRLVLAVDPSRKHADTQAWVRHVASVVQPSSLVSVARTLTATPGTVQELGYPVQYLG